MTSLRTSWGLDLNKIPATYIFKISDILSKINSDWYKIKDEVITLTDQGKHYADYIASQLFID
jgi:oxygen-independent coproporphyrinogen-3 oxidase